MGRQHRRGGHPKVEDAVDRLTQRDRLLVGPYPGHRLRGQVHLVEHDERGTIHQRRLVIPAATERARVTAG